MNKPLDAQVSDTTGDATCTSARHQKKNFFTIFIQIPRYARNDKLKNVTCAHASFDILRQAQDDIFRMTKGLICKNT